MRTHHRSMSALLAAATTALSAAAIAFAGSASAATTGLEGDCDTETGTVITLDLAGYDASGPNRARVSLDGSRPSRVSFGAGYNYSTGPLDGSVDHEVRVVVRAHNDRSGAAGLTFSDTIAVKACQA